MDDASPAQPCPPPSDATIDELIRWVAERRIEHPGARLSELVDAELISDAELVELVCVDLIGQRRRQEDVLVEHYLAQFNRLGESEEAILDLLDAEMCVRREMNELRRVEFFTDRFPRLAAPIRQLLFLEMTPPNESINLIKAEQTPISLSGPDLQAVQGGEGTIGLSLADSGADASAPDSFEGSFEACEQREITIPKGKRARDARFSGRSDDSIDAPIPIPPPAWMGGARCIATTPTKFGRYWLVTGRDIERGETVAMKVLPLPTPLGSTQRSRMLDLCEKTSALSHASWIPPRVAAISNGHLAVIRPWIFGTPLSQVMSLLAPDAAFRHLVRIAFTLSAAHRTETTHGSVSTHNAIVDHDSNVTLVDASSGLDGWIGYLSDWDNDLKASLATRIQLDTMSLLRLVASQCLTQIDHSWTAWPALLAEGIDPCQPDACAQIGDRLQSFLDSPPARQRSRWWSRAR
ncbi:MAG: hypothetical protein AAFU85_11665 [Planctomycetota bacterium]